MRAGRGMLVAVRKSSSSLRRQRVSRRAGERGGSCQAVEREARQRKSASLCAE